MAAILKNFPMIDQAANRLIIKWRRYKSFRNLRQQIHQPPVKIIIGASGTEFSGWLPTDIEFLNLLIEADWNRCFGDIRIDAMLAEHVWEHLNREDGQKAAEQCFAYLKPGGHLRVAIPDGFHPDPKYIEHVRIGGSGTGADDHKMLYNCESVVEVFSAAGFDVKLLEYFDAEGNFHAINWDPIDGHVQRSQRFDARNQGGKLNYTSLIIDAVKPR